MKFSFLSWNVEHFRGGGERLKRVAAHVRQHDPDIFGLMEIEGADILSLMRDEFPEHDFSVTDGPEVQEILVGWRRAKFQQAIFTQKREFKAFNPSLRPGALLSVRLHNQYYNLLFLHTDSGTGAPDFGNRTEMFEKVWKLKKAVDKIGGGAGEGNLIMLGDLNTMGLAYPTPAKKNQRVTATDEIHALGVNAETVGLRPLAKEFDQTWYSTHMQSELDHVLASTQLKFVEQGKRADGTPFEVMVRGWNQLDGDARTAFVSDLSDHSALFAIVK
ncbi:MAG TPA: endonuclease/exonuclease/phosphatase family protein [Candidatus Krumholzibacteria bacterium]|nr:endonuclease/exonuclease/phosphatase family protein [Candidatus Krumholzibacteria bacterium]